MMSVPPVEAPTLNQHCRTHRRQQHAEDQFQQGLIGQGLAHGEQDLKQAEESGHGHGDIGGADTEALAEHHSAQDKQGQVEHPVDAAQRKLGEVMAQHNGDTADAAKGKVVGVFEEVSAHRSDERSHIPDQKCFEIFSAEKLLH